VASTHRQNGDGKQATRRRASSQCSPLLFASLSLCLSLVTLAPVLDRAAFDLVRPLMLRPALLHYLMQLGGDRPGLYTISYPLPMCGSTLCIFRVPVRTGTMAGEGRMQPDLASLLNPPPFLGLRLGLGYHGWRSGD
jgi:hypothetical protein